MPKTSKPKKVEEINNFEKDLFAENVKVNPEETAEKKVHCKMLILICSCFGTFQPGEVGELPESMALELKKLGKCEILEEESGKAGAE